jgi:hypothetical protein
MSNNTEQTIDIYFRSNSSSASLVVCGFCQLDGLCIFIIYHCLVCFVFLMMLVFWQVCGPPGLMKLISGDKAKDKSQGEVYIYIYICICICLNLYLPSSSPDFGRI